MILERIEYYQIKSENIIYTNINNNFSKEEQRV